METKYYQYRLVNVSGEELLCWLPDRLPVGVYFALDGDPGGVWKVQHRYPMAFEQPPRKTWDPES